MCLKQNKCCFMLPQVQYLGHVISRHGIRPAEDKVQAIREAPAPKDIHVHQLKSFLGLLNFYAKFLSNLSTTVAPLYSLLQKQQPWCWGVAQQRAFQLAKSQLTSSPLLVHYSANKELLFACDTSPYGIGAVLSHAGDAGGEKPITYVSRSLTPAERRYSQLDKEVLAIVFWCYEVSSIPPWSAFSDSLRPQTSSAPPRRTSYSSPHSIIQSSEVGFDLIGIQIFHQPQTWQRPCQC